jgi:membrane protease YdiL (CAAX protease family)
MPWDFWLIFAFLGVVVPWRGRVRLKRLLEKPAIGRSEKIKLYAGTIAAQWVLVAVVAWRSMARGLTATELGLGSPWTVRLIVGAVVGAALLCGLHWLRLMKAGKMQSAAVESMRKLAVRILPASRAELIPYIGLALTAGICEEFLYRGFVMAALGRVGLATWAVVLASSALFGLAHAYQGWGGVVGTFVIGLVFGVSREIYGNLFPAMVWHSGVDVIAGVAGPRYLFRTAESKEVV